MKPTIPANATPEETWEAIRVNIDGVATDGDGRPMTEPKALTYVQTCLGFLGYAKAPAVVAGKVNGLTCRIYKFQGTPVGNLVLFAGPQAIPRLVKFEDLVHEPQTGEIYILADKDSSSMARKAGQTADRLARPAKVQAAVARAAPPPASAPAAPAPRAPRTPRAPRSAPAPAPTSTPAASGHGGISAEDAAAVDEGISRLAAMLR